MENRYELNKELAQMLKGGVIMDVTTLNDFFSFFQQFDLTFSLTLDRMGDRFERVQVLHLGTGSHTIASHLSYGEIDVGTHGAFL